MNIKLQLIAAVAALVLAPSLAAADSIQGIIVSHEDNKLVVQVNGANTTVMLTDTTKVQAVAGLVGGQRRTRSASELIKGLAVNIDTVQNGAELDAATVTFKNGDLKTAQAVQAGTAEAVEKVKAAQAENKKVQAENARLSAENAQRLSMVGQFDTKGSVRVLFASGSKVISAKGKQDLQAIATQAMNTPGGLVRVVGHADSTGNPELNQRLSNQRASAVTAYLVANCHVPAEKMASSGGLGSNLSVDTDDSSKAQSRRVTVSILVSKASRVPTSAPSSQ